MKTKIQLLENFSLKTPVKLSHICRTELGIDADEIFTINQIFGNFELLEIVNQYGQKYIINPSNIL